MLEAEENILSLEPEATLVTPRFDAAEAQTAQPVVPLAAVRARRRVWPLLLVSALLGGVVSVAGLYFYQRPRAQTVAAPVAGPQEPTTTTAAAAQPETARIAATKDKAQTQMSEGASPRADVAAAAVVAPTRNGARTTTEAVREPVRPNTNKQEAKAQPARDANEARTQRAAVREARGVDVGTRRNAEAHTRPREVQPPESKPKSPPRNVDRIRDIFEGARPPV